MSMGSASSSMYPIINVAATFKAFTLSSMHVIKTCQFGTHGETPLRIGVDFKTLIPTAVPFTQVLRSG